MQSVDPKVDISFRATGERIDVDHNYALYSAISRLAPFFHHEKTAAMKTVRGRYIGEGLLDISPYSELVLRVPVSRIPPYMQLAGKKLDVCGCFLSLGTPVTRALTPSVALYAHLVTTRNGHDPARFEKEIQKQLDDLNVKGRFEIGKRRTFGVHGKQVVGYSMMVHELTAEESIILQENGLGGRRKMGCGFFEPWEG